MIVIDSSAVLGWQLQEDPASMAAIRRALTTRFLVPSLWPTEVANGLITAERRGRIREDERAAIAEVIDSLDTELAPGPGTATIARLAARTGLSAYDAEYLHLAIQRNADLLTCDRQLAAAAAREGVRLAPGSIAP